MSAPITVSLMGRLGNQLFQLAFGLWLADRSGLEVAFDLSRLRGIAIDGPAPMRSWVSEQPIAADRRWPTPGGRLGSVGTWIRRVVGPGVVVVDDSPSGSVPDEPVPAWWIGYWQQERFAIQSRDRFRRWFDIGASRPDPVVRVHVRRGDFVGLGRTLPVGWYRRAVGQAQAAVGVDRVEVVTDDRNWCSRELVPHLEGAEIAPLGDAATDLARLARSAALVASDSTYSWWAGFLGSPLVLVPAGASNLRELLRDGDRWIRST